MLPRSFIHCCLFLHDRREMVPGSFRRSVHRYLLSIEPTGGRALSHSEESALLEQDLILPRGAMLVGVHGTEGDKRLLGGPNDMRMT